MLTARGDVNVRDLLAQVRVPTLVLHARHEELAALSVRERRMLAAVVSGRSNSEIGAALLVSDKRLTSFLITGILGANAAWSPRPARNQRRPAIPDRFV